jgi:hypothetical protein
MPARAFSCGSILGCEPAHIAEIAYLRMVAEDRAEQHQNPFIDRIDQNDALSLLPLRLPCENDYLRGAAAEYLRGRPGHV